MTIPFQTTQRLRPASRKMAQSVEGYDTLNPESYVGQTFPVPLPVAAENWKGLPVFSIRCLARHFTKAKGNQLILDYGCGPSLPYSISAASKASKIVLAEYTAQNREFVKKWLDQQPSAHDWSPYFKYVVQTLEGRPEEDVIQREKDLRNKVEAVVPCDLTKEKFIEEDYYKNLHYDTVMSFLVLNNMPNYSDFESGLKKLCSLVKEGGHLLLILPVHEKTDVAYYHIGGQKFNPIVLKQGYVDEHLKQNQFHIISEDHLPNTPDIAGNCEGFRFLCACKKQQPPSEC